MKYKVLLLTSGVGSRLGNCTNYTNKALIRVGNKPTISHIIDAYPDNTEFVVTLGYFGNQIKEFLEMVYPNKKFDFAIVDNFNGKGSSPLYSLLQAKDYIDCPFIFHACDTIIRDNQIPEPVINWLGGYKGESSTQYATLGLMGDYVSSIYAKGQIDFDSLYIGLAGIFNYEEYFKYAQEVYDKHWDNTQLTDIDVTPMLIKDGLKFKHFNFPTWLDIGNIDKLKEARTHFESVDVLDKDSESIYIINGKVVKFFYDEDMVSKRTERAEILKDLTPRILNSGNNFYMYEYVDGELLSQALNTNLTMRFLNWSNDNLWKSSGDKNDSFYEVCRKFYIDKTNERLHNFFVNHTISDREEVINGIIVPKVFDMLKSIPEKLLCNVEPYNYHGDFISDNIIVTKDSFVLLDWRQDFGGDLIKGDIYYDLGKFNHNLIFNHKIINNGNYYVVEKETEITVDLLMSNNLYNCQKVLFKFVVENGFSINRVNLMSSIIWLNMAPLHNHPLDIFLYYFGKLNLFRALEGEL